MGVVRDRDGQGVREPRIEIFPEDNEEPGDCQQPSRRRSGGSGRVGGAPGVGSTSVNKDAGWMTCSI